MIDDHYNEIMIMNERSSYDILESNVKEKQNVEKSLEHKVGKLQILGKES